MQWLRGKAFAIKIHLGGIFLEYIKYILHREDLTKGFFAKFFGKLEQESSDDIVY